MRVMWDRGLVGLGEQSVVALETLVVGTKKFCGTV